MKRLLKKTKGLVRGAPAALLVSAAIHFVLLLLAGGLVVFTAITKKEKKFIPPPPVERPKMNLIKPRVKMKNPPKSGSTQRIVSKAPASMPDVQLPDVSGVGDGLDGGVGGFEMVPDSSQISIFGRKDFFAAGNDFEGTFYSFAYDRRMKKTSVTTESIKEILRRFIESGWNPMIFTPYFRSPQKLYTTQIFVPTIYSEFGPSNFGIPSGPDFDPYLWCVHYKGKIARKEGGRFRFWGLGDDFLLVQMNGKLVFDGSHPAHTGDISDFEYDSDENDQYVIGKEYAFVGQWFDLEPGIPVNMEVLLGEIPGGSFCAYLLVEQEGEDYERNRSGLPILPVFKTAEIPDQVKDKIKYNLIVGEGDLDSDLIFNVY